MSRGGPGLLCVAALVVVLVLAVVTGALPVTCNPPRHVVRLNDVGQHTACVASSPAPASRASR